MEGVFSFIKFFQQPKPSYFIFHSTGLGEKGDGDILIKIFNKIMTLIWVTESRGKDSLNVWEVILEVWGGTAGQSKSMRDDKYNCYSYT